VNFHGRFVNTLVRGLEAPRRLMENEVSNPSFGPRFSSPAIAAAFLLHILPDFPQAPRGSFRPPSPPSPPPRFHRGALQPLLDQLWAIDNSSERVGGRGRDPRARSSAFQVAGCRDRMGKRKENLGQGGEREEPRRLLPDYASACRKSSIKSAGSSRPTETRTVPGETPAWRNSASDMR
jgi:hypothetical protein